MTVSGRTNVAGNTPHTDLMRMATEDPVCRACRGAFFTSKNTGEQHAHMYVNMIVNHWPMMWEPHSITETHPRSIVGSSSPGLSAGGSKPMPGSDDC